MIVERAYVPLELVPSPTGWPFNLPAVVKLLGDGISFDSPITFLVGENGSGKSTLEAIAAAYGADSRGGHIGRKYAVDRDGGPLGDALRLRFAPGTTMARKPKGFFLRAETAYGVFGFMSDSGVPGYGSEHLLEVSHGESFLQVFEARFNDRGLFLLDEPEAALSFSSCLTLVAVLQDLAKSGAQVICATHSPVLASLPGAAVLQLSDEGIERVEWEELDLVANWRRYLDDPRRYLRHLLTDGA